MINLPTKVEDIMGYEEYLNSIKKMIDDLKAMTADLGLANTGDEYKVISELFTYKFLNDKLLYSYENRDDKSESFDEYIDFADSQIASIEEQYLLNNLFQRSNEKDFHKTFDKAMIAVSDRNQDVYSIETSTGSKKPLFEPLSAYLRDPDKENELAKRAINILCKYNFGDIYNKGWDYFSSVFEYLIKDFNKDSGKYAEYYTPASAGAIMADILYNDTPVDNVTLYDPAAGSGTLLLSMADKIGTRNCTLYSQDRAQKSTQFLRVNLILNNLAHSLENVVEGNTMIAPAHLKGDKIQQFDFIVSNPPFNVDFSADVETMKVDKYGRFFAGIPNIPPKDKSDMAIYLCFLQHILSSLNDKGKAAVVVPAGFLTVSRRTSKIAYMIREKITDKNWLRGVISMPSNIFATTGTNVSILFIDKTRTKEDKDVILIDASKLGDKVKLDDGQRTILSSDDEKYIIDVFKKKKKIDNFSVVVSNERIKQRKYSYSAGHYFDLKVEFEEISDEEFSEKISTYSTNLDNYFAIGNKLEKEIKQWIEVFKHE